MKAEDTVMADVTPVALLQNQRELWGLLREQAEISFKAGIREVVEELRKREVYAYAASPSGVHLVNLEMIDSWQAQLKDWGIDAR